MSGRGTSQFILAQDPSQIQAVVGLTVSTSSPTCSLTATDDAEPFYIVVTAAIKRSSKPGEAITLCTNNTPLARHKSSSGGIDTSSDSDQDYRTISPAIRSGAIKDLVNVADPERAIFTGPRSHGGDRGSGSGEYPEDLREEASLDFITIPASGSVSVKHFFPREDMLHGSDLGMGFRSPDIQPGEKYVVRINQAHCGTSHWFWDGEGKKLREWKRGPPPSDEWVQAADEDGDGLAMEVENEAEFTFT